ncbi:hemerythrin domain-containing protein [Actinomadura roseirufa]|uniref:hemerythrin domain-containing protein n=1 Tax=Actinomadura roseirufa TaxID=2094049 RepID=UPI0010415D1B|nr:hemerythrin domain-containing protein [Actinomadura roseirufa]
MAADYDMTIMQVTHNALRRDLRHLGDAAERLDPGDARGRAAVGLGWTTLKAMLTSHHEGEDKHMWPRMRAGLGGDPDGLAVLAAMEAEHGRIDPLIAAVDTALAKGDAGAMAAAAVAFGDEVAAHLRHEEREALPLVRVAMSAAAWDKVMVDMRGNGLAALKSAPEFFPWLIGEADPADRAAVLTRVPPPLRLLYAKVWLPRYARQPRWHGGR